MAEQEAPQKQIVVQKLYLKDFSFESPNSPKVFASSDWKPKTNLNLRSAHANAENGRAPCVPAPSPRDRSGRRTPRTPRSERP